jgi:transcriptional regulator with XRE-family HTH domain
MGELKDMMDLRESRNRAKKTQAMLSVATGLDQGYLSRVESGERSLSPATAKKLAAALKNTNAATLVFSNRSAMLQRAVDRGDVAGAIEAAKSAYKTAEANGWTDDDDGDEALSELLDAATKFVESAASGTYEDEEVYGYEAERDPLGHRVGVTKAAASREAGIWPSLGGGAVLTDPEEYDPVGHDGRNIHGHRVAPLPAVDEEEE